MNGIGLKSKSGYVSDAMDAEILTGMAKAFLVANLDPDPQFVKDYCNDSELRAWVRNLYRDTGKLPEIRLLGQPADA